MKQLLNDFKKYLGNFEYDLIIMSENRMAVIHQLNNQYMELNDSFMICDILEELISTTTNLTDIFNCTVKFSTDEYLQHYLRDFNYQQVV